VVPFMLDTPTPHLGGGGVAAEAGVRVSKKAR